MKNKTTHDAQGVDFEVTKSDFEFVQKDAKIHDVKFETKATTFGKDAFKRFCKNKSSVVAAVIIGIIAVLAIFVPTFSTANVEKNIPEQGYLYPKVFKAGTGFWDGTKKFENILYDYSIDAPAGFKANAVVKITDRTDSFTNLPSQYAEGGYLKFVSEAGSGTKYIYNYAAFPLHAEDNTTLTITFGDTDDLNGKLGDYQIYLSSSSSRTSGRRYALTDVTSSYEDFSVNLSSYISENGIADLENAYIQIEIKQSPDYEKYILMKSIEIHSDTTDESVLSLLDEISMTDANAQCLISAGENGKFSNDYWRCSGRTEVYQATVSRVSFVYDYYEAKLGMQYNFEIGRSLLNTYIANGWCSYDFDVGPSSFVKLSDKCPIEAIHEEKEQINGSFVAYNYVCDVVYYRYLGYNSMPSFIFGTDASGRDLFTYSFKALRSSLLLAIVVSAINFIIGLVWGSISGYFGGNVDLFMERFCDILGGVPFVVVITLTILLLGNKIGTFAIALCLTGWMGTAARTRTQFYRFKGREYILAARTLGASDMRLIFKHILPNSLGTIITSAVLMIPSVIFSEATIAYLGLGLKGVKSFGVLLSENQVYYSTYPMLIIFPSIIISLLMISFNLFGNGLRDALNPSLKGSD